MSGFPVAPWPKRRTQLASFLLPAGLLLLGLVPRLLLAKITFLNPDEALHYLLSNQASLGDAYRASLTSAHPPLLILVLYYWHRLGHAEWWLRLPSIVAAEGSCGMMFLWLKTVTDRDTALVGLTLLLFSPSLVALSAEVRQYPLLLLFTSASLYFFERALSRSSARNMLLSSLALYLALLTHYSALIFALALGLYALSRLRELRREGKLLAAWAGGQLAALGLCAFLFSSHVVRLRSSGLPQEIAQTWLRASIFEPGQDRLGAFLAGATVRLFRYFVSQGTVGMLCLLLFLLGIAFLLFDNQPPQGSSRVGRPQLALLLGSPFLITAATSIAGIYPYGGTRHEAILAGFAFAGASIAWVRLTKRSRSLRATAVVLGLAACYLVPSPIGPYISPKNQNRRLMAEALALLRRSATPDSILYTDPQGRFVLGYYLCPNDVLAAQLGSQPFVRNRCGAWQIVTPSALNWAFEASNFALQMAEMRRSYGVLPQAPVWLFQAGWIDYREDIWISELDREGCQHAQNFGADILICRMSAEAPQAPAP